MYKETVPKSFMTREISNIIDERLYEIRAIASFYQTIGSHGDDVSLALLMGILKISDIKKLGACQDRRIRNETRAEHHIACIVAAAYREVRHAHENPSEPCADRDNSLRPAFLYNSIYCERVIPESSPM